MLLILKSNQGDVTESFIHADVDKGENIYVEMTRVFNLKVNNGNNKALKF